jgi:anaerobic magnesium-protoporphyrin IX monomethyl ester cyclase
LKISLVNPPYSLDDYFGGLAETGSIQQPLGLGYISSYLKTKGQMVQLLDAAALRYGVTSLISAIKGFSPDIIGISVTTPGYLRAATLAQRIKAELRVPMIIGGSHVTSLPMQTLENPSFDYAVVGEGELTSLEFLEALERGRDLSTVKGIAYREGGMVRLTPRREYIADLDTLPFPDRASLPPLQTYHPSPSSYRRLPLGTMVTSRGCPHHCIFCDRAVFGNAYRARGAKSVVDEMEILVHHHGAREIRFWDDTFNLRPTRVLEICREIGERKLDVEWSCVARVGNMTEEVLRSMRRAGCWQIDYGIETGNPDVLKSINKGITMDLVRRAVRLSRKAGIRVRGFFMLGLPGETEETMQETISFAKSLPLDVAVFHITTPLPGTELFEQAKSRGEISPEVAWDKYLMFSAEDLPYVTKGLTKELLRWYESLAYKEFYMRPGYILDQARRIRTREDIARYAKAFFTVRSLD